MKQLGIIFLVAGFCFAGVAVPSEVFGGPAEDVAFILGWSENVTRFVFGIASVISFLISGGIGKSLRLERKSDPPPQTRRQDG